MTELLAGLCEVLRIIMADARSWGLSELTLGPLDWGRGDTVNQGLDCMGVKSLVGSWAYAQEVEPWTRSA